MPIIVNLRHLEDHGVRLQGELPLEELDIDARDEVIQLREPLLYDLEVQMLEHALLVEGRLEILLACECVRCLKPFNHRLLLERWTCHLPLQGEDAVTVNNDCVDLTPSVREDILLEFPQHPLCNPECGGLPKSALGKVKTTNNSGQAALESSAWAELNKLKF